MRASSSTHHTVVDDSSIALAALPQAKARAVQLETHRLSTNHITKATTCTMITAGGWQWGVEAGTETEALRGAGHSSWATE